MSFWSGVFGGGSDASNSAQQYLSQIPQVAHDAFDPYINMGQTAGNIAQDQYASMAQDPQAYINAIMAGYQPSEGYQYQQQQLTDQAQNAAAAGGYTGTESDYQKQMEITQGLLGEDMQQWLNNVMGAQQKGLGGEQQMYNIGYGASGQEANMLAGGLGQQAQAAYAGGASDAMQKNALFNSLMGLGAGVLGYGMGVY